jgi:archaellum component FlaC
MKKILTLFLVILILAHALHGAKRQRYNPYDDNFQPAPAQQPQQPPQQHYDWNRQEMPTEAEEHKYFEGMKEKMKNAGDSKALDTRTNDFNVATQTSLLILEALEEVTQVVRKSSTKEDISHVIAQINDMVGRQQSAQSDLAAMKDNIRGEFKKMLDGLASEGKNLHRNIEKLEKVMSSLTGQVSVLQSKQAEIHGAIGVHGESLKATIREKNSYTPWIIFLLCQVVLAAGWIYYQKIKDTKRSHHHMY